MATSTYALEPFYRDIGNGRYAITSEADLREGVDRLNELFHNHIQSLREAARSRSPKATENSVSLSHGTPNPLSDPRSSYNQAQLRWP